MDKEPISYLLFVKPHLNDAKDSYYSIFTFSGYNMNVIALNSSSSYMYGRRSFTITYNENIILFKISVAKLVSNYGETYIDAPKLCIPMELYAIY